MRHRPQHSGPSNVRTSLVLFVAFLMLVTGLPFALAGVDPVADESQTEAAAGAEETGADDAPATEEPVVVPVEPEPEPEPEPEQPPSETPVDEPVDEPVADEDTQAPAPDDDDRAPVEDNAGDADEPKQDDATEAPERAAAADVDAAATTAPDGGDFSIDWAASQPASYSHVTGGGVYATGSNATTVESLNAGDFACGDIVSYLAAITVDDSNATDASTLQFTTRFATLTSSETGIGHEEIVRAVINTGDPGMVGDARIVSLDKSTGGGDLIGTITVADLEAGEQIIVRVDVRLGCQTGGRNVGTIHASLDNILVVAPVTEVVPGGAQTIPFKQDGVARDLVITKDEVGPAPASASYTVAVSCLKGTSATLNFDGDGSQSAGLVPEGDTCTVTETVDGGADRTTVSVNGGAAQTGKTTSIVIGATNEVTFTNTFFVPTVEVGKTASPTTVEPGDTITYTITARNTSGSATVARDVVVTDNLDDDLADVAASFSVAGGASQPCTVGGGNTISCAVGDLAIGESAVVAVTARATIAACGEVLNRASAAGSNFDAVNSPQVTVTVHCEPDVNIVKSAAANDVVPGDDFTYTIVASNSATATAPANGVVVTDNLDDSLTGARATYMVGAGAAQNCAIGAGNTVTCNIGTLAIGESAVVTITVTATPASCPSVTNRASVSGSNFPTEQSDEVDVDVTCTPGLAIEKSASETSVVPGDDYFYEITVRNPSSSTATTTDVVVTDDLHDGLDVQRPTFSVAGGAAQDCDAVGAGNTIRCVVGDLDPGESAVITVDVTATVAACGAVENVATAAAGNITTPVDSNEVLVTVNCAPALDLDKTASAGTVDAGDDITYTITATNPSGTATATAEDVVITDNLDDDLFGLVATVTSGGVTTDCVLRSDNFVRCDAGDIPIDGTAVVTITATTTEAACGVVTNVSSADGANFTTVTSPTVDVTVVCPPVIVVEKSASAGRVDIGDDYTYTITTTNNALPTGAAGQDVVITDDLDDDLAGVSATYSVAGGASQPCDATGAGNTVRCAIGDLPVGESADVIVTATATLEACGSVRNVSQADGTNFTTVFSEEVNVLIPCPTPPASISLVKTGVAPDRAPGDLITYTYLITNTGQTTLTDITLDDDILGSITVPKTTLTAGESMTATATHLITQADIDRGEVHNIAETTGRPPTGPPVRDTDDETIPLEGVPGIELEKTPDREFALVGETVAYEYVITNTGTTRLTDITLVDDKIGTIVSVDDALTLEPGESTTVTADYTITEDDLAEGDEVVNVAIATGLPPNGPPVDDDDTAKVGITEVLAPGALTVVKEVDGDGSPAPGAEFGFTVDCGGVGLGQGRGTFTIGEDGGIHEVGVPIPDGTECTVTETRDAGADSTTVAVDGGTARAGTATTVTILEDETTTVTFVNTFGDRPIIPPVPPVPPDDPDLPATGTDVALQLTLALGLLGLGVVFVRRFRPAAGTGRGRPSGWTTRM